MEYINPEETNDHSLTLIEIEELEYKYLKKYFYFLKFVEDEMLCGFKTKEYIRNDWKNFYGTDNASLSDFSTGAERIVYSLLNGKGIGQPNSSPVGADMFFEVEDAYIHIDMKTVQTDNIGDYTKNIFVGRNQNSYKGNIIVNKGRPSEYSRLYLPNLPAFYTKVYKVKDDIVEIKKPCLTYFITILSNSTSLNIEMISIICMPNGKLYDHYGDRPLKAGKTEPEARFNFLDVNSFELFDTSKKRVKVVYYNKDMDDKFKRKLSTYYSTFIDIDTNL